MNGIEIGAIPSTVKLFDTLLTASAANISIPASAIPQAGFRHLRLRVLCRGDYASVSNTLYLRFNNDSAATNYSGEYYNASGSGIAVVNVPPGAAMAVGAYAGGNAPAGAAGWSDISIPAYNLSTLRKIVTSTVGLTNADTTTGHLRMGFYGEWLQTAAITTILLMPELGNFAPGTLATLYGER